MSARPIPLRLGAEPPERVFSFLAALADRGAIVVNDDTAMVRLEVPKIEIVNMIGLTACTRVILRVVVSVEPMDGLTGFDESEEHGKERTHKRTARHPFDVAGG